MNKLQMLYHLKLGITNATIKEDEFLKNTTTKALKDYNDFKELRMQSIKMIESNNYNGLINNLKELYKKIEKAV